jgi:HAD superfamily hydrolase (TIGR01509 family)
MIDRPVLLVDVMDTLVYNPFNKEIPDYFGLTQSALLEDKDVDAWIQFERGEISEAEYFRRYSDGRRRFDVAEFKDVVERAYRFVDGAEEFLQRLRSEGYEIHALSNYPIWFKDIERRLGLSRFLQWSFVSCLTGVRKPSAEAYLGAAGSLKRQPADCLLIDDNLANCESAEAVCMPALHFTNWTAAWAELARRGYVT